MQTATQMLDETMELWELSQQIADASAVEIVESFSVEEKVDGQNWLNADHGSILFHERELLEPAARYLELRRLLVRHQQRPNCVRVVREAKS